MKITLARVSWSLITLIYTILTFLLSKISTPPKWLHLKAYIIWNIRTDWFLHSIEYGILSGLLLITLKSWNALNRKTFLWATGVMVFTGIIGLTNEFVQAKTPKRTLGFDDVIANLVGSIIFITIIMLIWTYKNYKIKNNNT